MKRILLILSFLMCIAACMKGQPLYSQYQYNKFLINPAIAGSSTTSCLNITARNQWAGYYGAPKTYSLSYQSRISKSGFSIRQSKYRKGYRHKSNGRVGLGFNLYSDINGLIHKNGFLAAYSYSVWLDNETQMSFGLSASGYYYKINEKEIQFEDDNEPFLFSDFRKGTFIPDFNFGTYIINRKYAVGFSTQDLMEGKVKTGSKAYKDLQVKRSYYLFGNYVFDLDNTSLLEPSVLIKTTGLLNPQVDAGLTYFYDNTISAGITYRTGSAVITNIGYKKDRYFVGYSFDYTLQPIQRSTHGSHEIVIAIRFGAEQRKNMWLDRF